MARPKRFVMVGDNHGSMQHDASVAALWRFLEDYAPDITVHLGDLFDFSAIRRGARDDEQAVSLRDDWDAGTEFFERFFSYGKERHFLRGNHDERIYFLRSNTTGLVRDYAEDGIKQIGAMVKKHKVKMLPYDAREGVLRLGHLKAIHGFHAGANAARQHATVYGNCVYAHTHSDDVFRTPGLELREAVNCPCLCDESKLEYIRAKTGRLRWVTGWIYGVLFDDGDYQLFQAKEVGGKFYAAQDIKTY